jgi:hypothetical protein
MKYRVGYRDRTGQHLENFSNPKTKIVDDKELQRMKKSEWYFIENIIKL